MAVPNCNSRNPFADASFPAEPLVKPEPDLLVVAKKGIALVTAVTKYLSTLPHPIEVVEELVAVCAVTSTLLTSLQANIERFSHLQLSSKESFMVCLCQDILFGFRLLGSNVEKARAMRVFEPNATGLVRMPRVAWALVLSSDVKVAALRSRLYVEKYRVRVLIEAVSWKGLESLTLRSERQNEELMALQRMLPLITERLIGVQKDYTPRLKALRGDGPTLPTTQLDSSFKAEATKPEVKSEHTKPVVALNEKMEFITEKETLGTVTSKISIHSSTSTDSLASTASSTSSNTIIDDSILETWILRHEPQRNNLDSVNRRSTLFGIPVSSTQTSAPAYYYVKPVSSCPSEIKDLRKQCQGPVNEIVHKKRFEKTILSMHETAQWEIQKLLEAREAASSSNNMKRTWNVVGFMERPRRSISASACGKSWRQRMGLGKKESVEWVLVLKGETVDTRCRVLPVKHMDPWSPVPKPVMAQRAVVSAPVQIQCQQAQQQQQAGVVLRHVEQKRVMGAGEAREKMEEIIGELFVVKV